MSKDGHSWIVGRIARDGAAAVFSPPALLSPHEVHVWRASAADLNAVARDWPDILSADERTRAARFKFVRDRDAFSHSRVALRLLLGGYLSTPPREVQLDYEANGKPYLRDCDSAEALRFNLSHASGIAVVALTRGSAIGIDVEYVRTALEQDRLAERFFSPGEVTALRALPPELRVRGFFSCWTRKEAYLKGRGDGLRLPLDRFEVSVDPRAPAVLRGADPPADVGEWSLYDLEFPLPYVAALAVRRRRWTLKTLALRPERP